MSGKESLAQAYEGYFKIGAAINNRTIQTHGDLIAQHFNSATCENQMKFALIHPSPDKYDFAPADEIAAFCKGNGIPMRGHTLVWHNQSPDWLFLDENGELASRDLVLGRVKEHMQTVMNRYKDQIYCWDVVNEAIFDSGYVEPASENAIVRKSKWTDTVGEDYVEQAFIIANSVNPGAQLFYNDYNEWIPDKRDRIIQLIKGMQKKDIRVDGLGLQGHWSIYSPTPAEMRQSIDMYAELGLRLQVTELDASLYKDKDEKGFAAPPAELLDKQSAYYDAMFSLFREYKDILDVVTFWGVADDASWLSHWPTRDRKNWPLLFDDDHNPKDSYYKVLDFSR